MPMQRSLLKRFLEANTASPPLTDAALRAVWPVLQKAYLGRYELSGPARYSLPVIAEAITAATGKAVARITLVSAPDPFKVSVAKYGDTVDFGSSLSMALLDRHFAALKERFAAAHGRDAWLPFKDQLWLNLRRDVADPLNMTFWDDPFEAPNTSVGESLITSLFYFLAFAAAGDADSVNGLDKLIRLLPNAIPIGETPRQPGTWLAVLPSSPERKPAA